MSGSGFRTFVMPPLAAPASSGRPPGRPAGSGSAGVLGVDDLVLPVGSMTEDETIIDKRISRTFRVFDKLVQQAIMGEITALLVSGAGGVGKSHMATKALREAQSQGIIQYHEQNTTLSAVELYKLLYNNRNRNQITLIDDCDSIWADMEAIGVLKKALDTNDQRIVQWGKNSWVLNNDAIPNEFEYQGGCIFITNIDLQSQVEKKNKFSRHYGALLSRTTYLDMGIHSKREVLVRIKQVLRDTPFLHDHALNHEHGKIMVDWLSTNLSKVRALSIRSCIELGTLLRTDPDWEETAEVTMFRRS